MTKEEFEKQYAENSNITLEELHNLNVFAEPCNCNAENCKSWAMVSKSQRKVHYDLYVDKE